MENLDSSGGQVASPLSNFGPNSSPPSMDHDLHQSNLALLKAELKVTLNKYFL